MVSPILVYGRFQSFSGSTRPWCHIWLPDLTLTQSTKMLSLFDLQNGIQNGHTSHLCCHCPGPDDPRVWGCIDIFFCLLEVSSYRSIPWIFWTCQIASPPGSKSPTACHFVQNKSSSPRTLWALESSVDPFLSLILFKYPLPMPPQFTSLSLKNVPTSSSSSKLGFWSWLCHPHCLEHICQHTVAMWGHFCA